MELIFNELSENQREQEKVDSKSFMRKLLITCQKARECDFTRVRIHEAFYTIRLSEDYTITNWLNDPAVGQTFKTLLLGLIRSPFIEEGKEDIENLYLLNCYILNMPNEPDFHEQEPEGLSVAFLYNTLAISLNTHTAWNNTNIELLEKTETEEQIVIVKHVSCPEHLDAHREWIEENTPVELLETEFSPELKEIHLREDHGKDRLIKLSKKLVKSPYVISVINSLPFNPKEKNFIRKIYPDGKIEIVLTRTDEGHGLIVQTTGRNLRETCLIAQKLDGKYHD